MMLFVVLAVLLPWSVWRQMHPHEISRRALTKLPVIFGAIGLIGLGRGDIPSSGAAAAALCGDLALSVGFGVARGRLMPIWRDGGRWLAQGNRFTLTLWAALIAVRFAVGAVSSVTGWFPQTTTGEVFLVLAISFAVQNLVIARRVARAAVPA
jgi:hypothetical protein